MPLDDAMLARVQAQPILPGWTGSAGVRAVVAAAEARAVWRQAYFGHPKTVSHCFYLIEILLRREKWPFDKLNLAIQFIKKYL
ncbi:hypothetical protein NTA49_12365 [Photobacterium sp. TY 1-4]|uniref:Uncharacterized protein n=1 Tax=Pseudosulfitobacter koreensis TaxID=2968472 RepID=A0ABT1Z2H2_9RHOB|nr:hypothetical protein [Pseudosulfitobacter koreense]